ncbi:MAG: hypothetical protein AAFY71_16125 [Bacteroidota bacterium]
MRKITLPEEKLNELAQEVSARLLARHFFDKGQIDGESLKSFADHQQVNKFLIFQIYQIWEMQINKLYHPYFNLENKDIKQTIQILRNQISQNISVSEADFQPLLKRAVYNNLKLLLDPNETFDSFFFAQADKIPLEVYSRYAQFFSDLDFVVNSILRYYTKNNIDTVEKDIFFVKMKKAVEVYNKKSGQTFEQYRDELFKDLTGKTITQVDDEARKANEEAERAKREKEEAEKRKALEEKRRAEEEQRRIAEEKRQKEEEQRRKEEEARKAAEAERLRREQEEADRKRKEEEERKLKSSFFDDMNSGNNFFDLDDDEEEEIATPSEQVSSNGTSTPPPVVEEKEKPATPSFNDVHSNGNGKVTWTPNEEEPKVDITPPTPVAKNDPNSSVLDRFNKEPEAEKKTPPESKTSVLDMVNQRSKTVADRFSDNTTAQPESDTTKGKIKLDEIPIHKQYQYVQKVFEGNNVRFRIIVDKVNNANNADEIQDILEKFVLNNDKLNREDDVVKEFIVMLQNRF